MTNKSKSVPLILVFLSFLVVISCGKKDDQWIWQPLEVTASAYNSTRAQTNEQPNIAAWGDTLKPGMKCIAISRDLLKLGLEHNTPVKLPGFDGIYLVKDKMHQRWQNRIDIYMGQDVNKAREWGEKKIVMQYGVKRKYGERN